MPKTYRVYGDLVSIPNSLRMPAATLEAIESDRVIAFEKVSGCVGRDDFKASGRGEPQLWRLGPSIDEVEWTRRCRVQLDYSKRTATYALNGPLGKEAFEDYYLSQVLSFFFVRDNREPLHASVITNGATSLALMGDSGTGKSSMVAAFLNMGWKLVTDDLAMIDVDGWSCLIHPGFPRLKVHSDVASKYCSARMLSESSRRLSNKLVCHLDRDHYHASATALNCAVELHRNTDNVSETPELKVLEGAQAFLALLRNSYNSVTTDTHRERSRFTHFSRLAMVLPVYEYAYRSDLSLLDGVAERLANRVERSLRVRASGALGRSVNRVSAARTQSN